MPAAHRIGDIGSGHPCHFPPSPAIGGSPSVFVNNLPAMRVGDPYVPHACIQGEAGLHPRKLLKGSSSIFIDGCAAGRIGDAIDCGGEASTGSFNVMFG